MNNLSVIAVPPSDVSKANKCKRLTGIITVQYNQIKQPGIRIGKHNMHVLKVCGLVDFSFIKICHCKRNANIICHKILTCIEGILIYLP